MIGRAIFITTSFTALALAASLSAARAEDHVGMDHSKMDHSAHGAGAPAQWVDPGKAPAAPAAAKPGETTDAGKADEHAGHHGGGGGSGDMKGMDHGKGGMMGGMGGMGGMMGMMKGMMCGFTEHLEGRLAYLKAELKLTDAQTGAWTSFADAWRAAAQKASAKCTATEENMDHSKPAVLSKLSMMETHMVDHLDIVRAQKAAIEPFFATLSDEQKKTASETMTGIMKVGMSMGGGMGGGMMGGGMSHGGDAGGGMGGMKH